MLDEIILKHAPVYGVCRYSDIADSLIECRAKQRLPDNPESVITILFPYNFGNDAYRDSNISKYACVKDYHIVVADILDEISKELKDKFPTYQFKYFTDNSPVSERKAAVLSGIGFIGKNNLLINKEYGSFVFIGEIVTDMQLEYSQPNTENCLGCNLCFANCPTGALTENGVNKEICLSDISQKKGVLENKYIQMMIDNNCIWGCDICQNICPINQTAKIKPIPQFIEGFENKMRSEGELNDRAYNWRGIKVIERNLEIYNKRTE